MSSASTSTPLILSIARASGVSTASPVNRPL